MEPKIKKKKKASNSDLLCGHCMMKTEGGSEALYKNQDGLKAEDNDGNFIREINQNSFWARQG